MPCHEKLPGDLFVFRNRFCHVLQQSFPKRLNVFYPGKPLSVLKVILIIVMMVGLELEWVISVCDVMSVSFVA